MTSRLGVGAFALAALVATVTSGCGASQVVAAPDMPTSPLPAPRADAEPTADPKPADPAPVAASATTSAAVEKTPATHEAPPKEVSARHVLVQYVGSERAPAAVVRTREQAEALAEKVAQRAKRGESFTRLATEYSDEPGAAARGGALGKFTRGKMAPAFEEAAFHLKVGEISGVIETPFGFHVILRTE